MTLGAPILCPVDDHISILCMVQGFRVASPAMRLLAASCASSSEGVDPSRLHTQAAAPAHPGAVVATGLDIRALTAPLGPKATSKLVQEEGGAAPVAGTTHYRDRMRLG